MPFPILSKLLGVELSEVSFTEKLIATLGGGLSIFILIAISSWVLPANAALPVITSMGASAVLLFAVPHGPLSQPWPVLLGHGLSAFIGVVCAACIPQTALAAAVAVGLAIG
ncbi:MAG TPA: HPP family protein, partial [Chthoniobacterales bacterium]|nr:HPP family protein [Chthoniobacterales bacterium]